MFHTETFHKVPFVEKDDAWLEASDDLQWLEEGNKFTWVSERDGWRHLYIYSRDGQNVNLISPGEYDVIEILKVDDNAQTAGDLDNFTVKESQSLSGPNDGFRPIILQAEGGSTSVYVQAVIYDGTPTFTNTDSLQLVFHIEYLG